MIKHMLVSAALALTLSTLGSGVQAANKKVWRIHYIVLARGLDPFDLTVKQELPSAWASALNALPGRRTRRSFGPVLRSSRPTGPPIAKRRTMR
jgi:hypothetical protein